MPLTRQERGDRLTASGDHATTSAFVATTKEKNRAGTLR